MVISIMGMAVLVFVVLKMDGNASTITILIQPTVVMQVHQQHHHVH